MLNLLIILHLFVATCNGFNPISVHLNYSENYPFTINNSLEYILEFSADELALPPRVTISSTNAAVTTPLMVVARQPKELLSWQVPLVFESTDPDNSIYYNTSRTLCHNPFQLYNSAERVDSPIVSVATASPHNIDFTVRVDYQQDFLIIPNTTYNFTITPSEPKYFYYNFTTNVTDTASSNYDTVILLVDSDDSICMTVSIQNVTCPVFDTNEDVTFRGFYETVNRKGGITIPKYKFPHGFYAVFVAKPDDSDCVSHSGGLLSSKRVKQISMIVKPSITYQDYLNAFIITLGFIGGFYFIFIVGFFLCSRRNYIPRQMEYVNSELATPSTTCAEELVDSISVDETEYDTIIEADSDKDIRLSKSVLYLSDLARKDPRIHKHKSYLYLYNVLTVALFYGLPVVQLVITYQRVLNQTGEQDICYYNFRCAHPLGVISDFNHLFSNVGYVLFGVLFLWITYRREITHKDLDFERQYGIPQHYGMFYAMGVALIMEGVLSGSYHVCPSQANFQFDSSFMYVMAVLCMVKLYQNRHPDVNATAWATFGVLAVAILLGMIGIMEGNLYFWIFFTIIYLLSCFYISIQIYYVGRWRLDQGLVVRIWRVIVYDFWAGPINVIKPLYTGRMCLLVIGNLCNWALAFWGIHSHQQDFALFLLAIFMGNTLLYFFFYVLMKMIYKERVNKLTLTFLVFSACCATSALYFFVHKSISWAKTPAESRWYNQECALFQFYDFHDIWHFLSALGMFFTFMVLLTLDDDLSHTHRTRINVF